MQRKRKTAEENAEIRRKIMFDEFDYVDCNLDSSFQVRPNYPKGQIREFELDCYVVRESDRPVKDMWTGGGDGNPVMIGNYTYNFYNANVWRKFMELENTLAGSVFHGKSHEVLHDPSKIEAVEKPKQTRKKKTTEE
jgi:hypothetical protein